MQVPFTPIGILSTCFKEKFGVPRQPLLISEARGILKLNPESKYHAALSNLESFSHIWIVYVFHKHLESNWHPIIDPPTLVEQNEIGVFASRSPHRPNPIGLSCVKLDNIDFEASGGIEIHLSGLDILDGTPVLDIKPYLPYADNVPDATSGWATETIKQYEVEFSQNSLQGLPPKAKLLITQMLSFDPRPTSQRRSLPIESPKTEGMMFAFRVMDLDVHWQVKQGPLVVLKVI